MTAQHDIDLRANARLDRLLHRAGIEDRAEGHVLDLGVDQRLKYRRRVVVATPARIVGAVSHDQRSILAHAGLGRGNRVGDRPVVRRAFVPALPDLVQHRRCHCLGARLGGWLVAHGDRRAGIGNVGPGETCLDADDVDARFLFECIGLGQKIAHQAGLGCLAVVGALQHGRLDQQAARLLLALQRLLDERRGLHRALVTVDVWIGPIAHQRVGMFGHFQRGVGVKVERGDDGDLRSDDAAQRLQQRTFGIVLGRGDRRAMQRQTDRVELAGSLRRPHDHVADVLPRFPGERARRRGVGRPAPHRLPAVLLHRIDIAADFVLGAGEARHHRLALDQPALAIVLQRGRQFAEGVGLVHELRDQDAVRHLVTSTLTASPS